MRILIVPSWYPTPTRSVNGIFIQQQADALSHVHEVRVLYLDVLPRGKRRVPRRWISQERGYIEEVIEVPNYPLLWQFTYLWYLMRAFRKLRKQFAPDIVHCHIAVPGGWGAMVLRRLFNIPVVLTENSSDFGGWLRRPGLRWMAHLTYANVDVVIAVGEGLRRRITSTFGRTKRIVIVPNIVDTKRFTVTPFPPITGGYRLLFVGLMETEQKGVPVLLKALTQVRQRINLPIQVDLVGDGALRANYEAQARGLGLEGTVKFHGLQPHTAIAQMLQQSHALVLPSLHEALPLVVIEALASGRPVISTSCGGPEFMLDDSNGIVVEPGQVAPLADAIIQMLTNLSRYDANLIATDAANRYSYEAVTAALTEVYRSLVPAP